MQDPFALELLDFTPQLRRGQMETSADEGVLDLAMAYSVLESSFAGNPVRVDDVLRGSVAGYQAEIDDYYKV